LGLVETIDPAYLRDMLDVPISTLYRLRAYEQTFEEGTSDLTTDNCTQTVQSTEVYGGSYALDVSIANGNTGSVTTPARPVSPYQRVTFAFAHKENSYISDVKLIVIWRRSAGGVIDTEEYTLTPTTSWQVDARTLTAPNKASTMELKIQGTASGGTGHIYLDEITMDLVGQIFRVDGQGNLKVTDTDFSDKFPDASSLADNLSNPSTTIIGSALLGWDSSASVWERLQTDGSGVLKVRVVGCIH